MSHEEMETALLALIQETRTMRCLYVALVQKLIDEGLCKGTEEEIFQELQRRAEDLRREEANEAKVEARARFLRETWARLPKQ